MEKDVIKSYIRYLKLQRNMSGNTLDAYQRDLQKLLDYLDSPYCYNHRLRLS